MRYLRSLVCAGLAMMAIAVCAAMPATASPISYDPGIHVLTASAQQHPAPMCPTAAVHADHVIIAPDRAISSPPRTAWRSSSAGRPTMLASFDLGADFRISPHLIC